jgi:hypothetical protein
MGRMLTLIIYPNHEQNTKEVDQHYIPSGITEGCLGAQWWGGGGGGGACLGAPGKNDQKCFASTLGKLVRASVIEGQNICNGPPPKSRIW